MRRDLCRKLVLSVQKDGVGEIHSLTQGLISVLIVIMEGLEEVYIDTFLGFKK